MSRAKILAPQNQGIPPRLNSHIGMKDKAMEAKRPAKRQNDKKTPQSKTLIEARTEAKAKLALAVPGKQNIGLTAQRRAF